MQKKWLDSYPFFSWPFFSRCPRETCGPKSGGRAISIVGTVPIRSHTKSRQENREVDSFIFEEIFKSKQTKRSFLTGSNIVHITFLLETDSLDGLRPPTNELETTPITDIALVAPEELPAYGFTEKWAQLVADGFPGTPMYAGPKRNIGLQ